MNMAFVTSGGQQTIIFLYVRITVVDPGEGPPPYFLDQTKLQYVLLSLCC